MIRFEPVFFSRSLSLVGLHSFRAARALRSLFFPAFLTGFARPNDGQATGTQRATNCLTPEAPMMTQQRRIDHEHEAAWRMPDEMWERIYPMLLEDCPPRKGPGRKPADWRRVLNGIVFRLRTGCHWNKLPAEFGDDSTIHRWYQRWSKSGVMDRVLAELGMQQTPRSPVLSARTKHEPLETSESRSTAEQCDFERDDASAVGVRQ